MNQIQTQSPIPQSWRWLAITSLLITCLGLIVPQSTQAASEDARADKLMVVDCLLPGKVRKIGGMMTYLTPRRPVKTTTTDCEIRGGEHTSFDRANYATALKIWLPEAKQGDPQAQTYVGEIFEKGLGTEADYQAAATWYLKAAEQGYSPAQINLGQLYEQGLGVKHDMRAALNWYRRASGLEDDDLEWASSVRVTLEQQQQQIQQLQQLSSTSEEQLAAIRKQLQTAQSELGVRQKELKVARNKRDEISRQLARQDSIIDSSTTDGRQQKQVELDQEQARLDARRTELDRLAEEMKQQASLLTEKQRKSAQQNTLLENQFLIKQAETERLRKRMQGLNLELEQTRSELSEIDTRDRNLIARLQTAESERKSLQDSLLTSEQQVQSLQTELTSARGNLDQTVEQKSLLETQFLTKQAETERIRKRLQAVNLELDQSHSELSGSDSRDRAQMARLQAVESERASLQTSLMSSDQQVQSLQSELTSARENLDESASKYAQTINELDQRKILYEVDTQRLQADRDRLRSQAEVDVAEIRKLRAELKSQEQKYSAQIDSLSARYEESQVRVAQVEQELDSIPAPAPIEVAMAPPSIELFEPPLTLTRGAYVASVAEEMDNREVIGRVLAPAGLVRFNVNEQPVETDQDGLFTHWIPLTGGRTPVNMAVVDRSGQRVAFDFDLFRQLEQTKKSKKRKIVKGLGNYHALVIGNSNYENFTTLRTPAKDAEEVARLLKKEYGYKTRVLLDANRYDILSALNDYRKNLNKNDNLLVYYAGHGEIDQVNSQAYWLPVDSEKDNPANWISTRNISEILNIMAAKHVMVVADSCYSGAMSRSAMARLQSGKTYEEWVKWFKKVSKMRTRMVLSSGGEEPVNDGGAGEHSLFAQAFMDALQENDHVLDGYRLYLRVSKITKQRIDDQNLEILQSPQYAPIKFTGHEAGEFLFQRS